MFFCGNGGVTAFFPEDIRDNPFVPPVVLTSFKISDDPVPIGAELGPQEGHSLCRLLDAVLSAEFHLV